MHGVPGDLHDVDLHISRYQLVQKLSKVFDNSAVHAS